MRTLISGNGVGPSRPGSRMATSGGAYGQFGEVNPVIVQPTL